LKGGSVIDSTRIRAGDEPKLERRAIAKTPHG